MKTIKIILSVFLVFPAILIFGQGMIIGPNANVTVGGGGKLIVGGATDGMLTIKSTSAGTGSLVVDANAASAVSVAAHSNVELYLTGSNSNTETDLWHLVSPPVSDGVSGTFFGDYLLSYDETTNLFTYIVPTTVPLVPMEGYEAWAWVPDSKTDIFNGTLNNGSQSIGLTRSYVGSLADDNGWNLLGNPYPCAIDFDAASGWNFGNAEQKVWIWNTSGTYKGQFATHVRGGVSANGGSRYIPEEQGFFLHCTAPTTVSIDNNVRVHSSQAYYKTVETQTFENTLRLVASGNGYNHETVIGFNPDASVGYDDYDALYYTGALLAPRIYSVVDNNLDVCINTLPQITDNLSIPVGFKAGVESDYSVRVDGVNTFSPSVSITLFDQQTNLSRNLRTDPQYDFSSAPGDDPNRFLVIFGVLPFGTGQDTISNEIRIYSFGDAVFIKTDPAASIGGQVYIYDPIGRKMYTGQLSDTDLTRISPDLCTGYYIVKVVTSESVCSKKVYLER